MKVRTYISNYIFLKEKEKKISLLLLNKREADEKEKKKNRSRNGNAPPPLFAAAIFPSVSSPSLPEAGSRAITMPD